MENRKSHPVWEVYDLRRTCRFKVKYWSVKLIRLRTKDFWIEYMLMATAPGSAIAGIVFWSTNYGRTAWSILTVLAASLAVAKPLLKFSDKIERLQKVVTQYKLIEFQLEALGNDIRRKQQYSATMVSTYKSIESHIPELSKDEPIQCVDQDLRKSCYKEVNEELPPTSFYVPTK